ncbi:phosphopantetheine-binding protein [Mycoplasmoides gallisepticum]|uniref:Acyl carrier protein n=4 Tax=Mycoplasmoides gallisepticum TaxID=2096 RepID=Q7NBP1_MYCGA|nr:phosphopantetheine-binding protein [Mycoplasmoides gallisepticum]AAP56575.2 Acyl carrier protein [Mycoplasmoides gallisepticum str. R(low)]ADC30424.1 Acyl carrier protein [Mycoplasmoides gallisepticum str. R(high)]ADC31540.1 Acyl carrier protein [Mycoplasmoides gallisepticum str. F]AFP75844.1 Acyl carrier protein [Mycoplasmoides gallisepticum VA94_7994-1-7P]AFP76611.1 Acyl carrier protein [Mycoplasmoides gallisepticum NC95_13295-2-2P]
MEILSVINNIAKKKKMAVTINDSNINKSYKELGIDSLDLFDIIVELESEFNIEFSDEKLMKIKTINDLILYIKELKK